MRATLPKSLAWLAVCAAFSLASTFGQSTNTQATVLSPKAAAEKKVVRPPNPRKAMGADEKIFTYSGFLVDFRRAEKPFKMLSLRQPADPAHDADNLLVNPRTGRTVGFKLFSLDF